MKGGAATAAIVRERLRRDAVVMGFIGALCGGAAFLQRFEDPYAHLAGALLFGTLAAAGSALMLHAPRHRELALYELSAPIYGRELARAHATVCAILTLAGAACYWAVTTAYHRQDFGAAIVATSCALAVTLSTLVARAGDSATQVAAILVTCALWALAFAAFAYPLVAVAACLAVGLVAIREYGEALARG